MTALRRTKRYLGRILSLATVLVVAIPTLAVADDAQPTKYPWAPDTSDTGPIIADTVPVEAYNAFQDCPTADKFHTTSPLICIVLDVTGLEMKLGKTVAKSDQPMRMTVGVGVKLGDEIETEIVAGGDGGTPASVPIAGGILGLPQLDPILQPLGVLSVSATPQIGAAGVDSDPLAFLSWLGGSGDPVQLSLPMSIKLNNTLLGPSCTIPEFTMHLINGTTTPPAGVAPMTGTNGPGSQTQWFSPGGPSFPGFTFPGPDGQFLVSRTEFNQLVDNTFAVPGATECNTLESLGLSGPLGKLLKLDSVVNSKVGLPAAPGTSYIRANVDTFQTNYALLDDPIFTNAAP